MPNRQSTAGVFFVTLFYNLGKIEMHVPAQLVNVCPDTSCGHQLSRLFEARTLVF